MWRTTIGTRLFVLSILVMSFVSHAQQPPKVYRIGYLTLGHGIDRAFREALAHLGYVEGHNLVLEGRFAQGNRDRLPALAAELVQLGVEVIVTATTPAALTAKDATTMIPIVMAGVVMPVEHGLATSFARSGGNVTGLTNHPGPGFTGKRLALLKDAVPAISRVGVFWDSTFQSTSFSDAEAAAQALGITAVSLDVQRPEHFDAAFATVLQERVDALVVSAAQQHISHANRIIDFATTHRLPTMFYEPGSVEAGGLMAYSVDWSSIRQRAAVYVDKILRGAKPADLPVEQPTKFELVINLKAAQALGLTIPPTLLFQADKVIK
jgi:putative ABC transport system substrate-binding protein